MLSSPEATAASVWPPPSYSRLKAAIFGRRKDVVDQVVSEIGPEVIGIVGDLADLNDLDRLYAEIDRHWRRLDIVFANAGILTARAIDQVTPDVALYLDL